MEKIVNFTLPVSQEGKPCFVTAASELSSFTDGNVLKPDEIWATGRGTQYRVLSVDRSTGQATLRAGVNGSGAIIRKQFNPPPHGWTRKSGAGIGVRSSL